MKQLYIIAGPNGAGKTTASFTVLPEMLDCQELVNADEIARGLSPFRPESVSFLAGRIMLERIADLIESGEDSAFETTLATKSYANYVQKAQAAAYRVTLLFFWLNSPDLATKRVAIRVQEGGHGIPEITIRRRYENGLRNFFGLYEPLVDKRIMVDNSFKQFQIIAEGYRTDEAYFNKKIWMDLKSRCYGK